MGMYNYKQRGTYLNGFLIYIERNHPDIRIKTFSDLNNHLKAIRIKKEPSKPVSKNVEKNGFYIQENYDWQKDVISYFKEVSEAPKSEL